MSNWILRLSVKLISWKSNRFLRIFRFSVKSICYKFSIKIIFCGFMPIRIYHEFCVKLNFRISEFSRFFSLKVAIRAMIALGQVSDKVPSQSPHLRFCRHLQILGAMTTLGLNILEYSKLIMVMKKSKSSLAMIRGDSIHKAKSFWWMTMVVFLVFEPFWFSGPKLKAGGKWQKCPKARKYILVNLSFWPWDF